MTVRSRWLGLGTSLVVAASFIVAGLGTTARAAAPARHASKPAAATNPKCKKRNTPKGVVRISDWEFPDTMNPDQSGLAVTSEIDDGVYDSLWFFNNNGKLVPDIAIAIPTVKNGGVLQGGKEYVVHLKPYATFSNGKEITSADIKFSWQIGMDSASGPACSSTCDIISRIDTPNKTTVVFHLKQADGAFVTSDELYIPGPWPTSWPNAWSNDPHAAANKLYGDTSFNFETPGYPTSGPYYVSQFVNNDRVVAVPNPHYQTLSCGAYFKEVLFTFFATKAALIAGAASHQTDVTTDYTLADMRLLRAHTSAYHLDSTPAYQFEHLELNQDPTYNGKPNPLHNVKVRQAIALAVDKVGMLRSVFGVSASVAKQYVGFTWLVNTKTLHQPYADTKLTGAWDPIAKKYVFNTGTGKALADAKRLMAQAGYPNGGFSLDWVSTQGNAVRQAQEAVFASNMAKLGITVNPTYPPASKLFGTWDEGGTVDHGSFQVGDWAYVESTPDPAGWILNQDSNYIDRDKTVHSVVNSNDSGIRDSVIDHAYQIANRSTNAKVRQKYYNIIQTRIVQNADWIVLYYRPSIATNDGAVKNFKISPLGEPEWNMYEWQQGKVM